MRERVVEKYLHDEVTRAGGTTRKMKGRIHDCDRLVIWPHRICVGQKWNHIHFVECKAPRKKARAGQVREHARLRKFGCVVHVLDTHDKVDNYVRGNK